MRLLTAAIVGAVKFLGRKSRADERRRTGDTDWVFTQTKHKRRVVATTFGVPFVHPVFFRLSREGCLDRFFKRIGFSHEIQTGDRTFDEKIYIACDHPALAAVLQEDAAARDAICSLFVFGTERIYADGAHLWVHCDGDTLPDELDLAKLATVRDALQAVPAEYFRMLRDGFFWRALLVESIAWSLAFYGAPAIIEIATRSHPQYFDWLPVIKMGLLAAVGVFALLLGLAWRLLRGSSRAHRVFTESVLVLAIGVPLSSIELVSDANIALDRSAPIVLEPVVTSKYTYVTSGRKGRKRTHYGLRLWRMPGAPVPIPGDLEVSSRLYDQAREGGKVTVELRAGALGIPWVADIRPAPP